MQGSIVAAITHCQLEIKGTASDLQTWTEFDQKLNVSGENHDVRGGDGPSIQRIQ